MDTLYRARTLCLPDGRLLDNGAVLCRAGRIARVDTRARLDAHGADAIDLGDVLLLPGLVNAHAHLRLTHLHGRLGARKNFVAWLGKVAARNRLTRTATLERSIRRGAAELLAGGVTAAVEIDMDGLSAATLADSPLRLVFAHELIRFDPAQAEAAAEAALEAVERQTAEPLRRAHGLAPHAPYSVAEPFWRALAGRLRARPLFQTIHMAESIEETEMLAEGRGRMLRRFRLLRLLPRGWRAPGCSPIAFLEGTGILEVPGVAAHCGQADEADARRLARGGWTVAFCPGTHEYFGRPPWPLERFRQAGVPVCVATDSAASNPTGLSLMAEMQRLARGFPALAAGEILAAATTIPARAMGWGEALGRIAPGWRADFSAWRPCPEGGRLERSWFGGAPPTSAATIIDGRIGCRAD